MGLRLNMNPIPETEELIMPRIGWKRAVTALALGMVLRARDIIGDGGQWEIANETVLLRPAGLAEVRSWLQGGANVS